MHLSVHDAKDFLACYLGGAVGDPEPLQGGDWSQAFGFTFGDRDFVVRFGRHKDDFEKDRAAFRFSSPDLPVPEVLSLEQAFDGFFCISRRMSGEFLETLDANRMERMVPSIFRTLDALREANSDLWIAEVGAPSRSWPEQLLTVDEENDRLSGWHDRMATSPTGTEPFQRALAYLRNHVGACPGAPHLLHNDLLHCNVLVANDVITGVFDWGCAGLGDFLYELAMFTFYSPWFPAMQGIDWQAEAKDHYRRIALRVDDFDQRLACYEVHLGLAGMAYCSFINDFSELDAHARRTMELLSL